MAKLGSNIGKNWLKDVKSTSTLEKQGNLAERRNKDFEPRDL